MINLEALQVFSIDDGAGGLVLAAWVESSTGIEGVPKVQRIASSYPTKRRGCLRRN